MQSMEELYRTHSQTVYRYLLSLTRDPSLAEELTQETFFRAIQSVGRFDGSCKVSTWLCAIAKNALSAYRRKHPAASALEETSAETASPEEALLAETGRVELLRRLHGLGAEMREVLYLRLFGDLSFREIGDILSRSETWARVTYYRGKEALRKELESHGE